MSRRSIKITNENFVNRIDLVCIATYGYSNDDLINKIIELNPGIDFFEAGLMLNDSLILPDRIEI